MKSLKWFGQFVMVIPLLSVLSCQMYRHRKQIVNETDTYFSIKQYAADQIQTNIAVPLSLLRIIHLDGKVDTTIANFMSMDWAPIFKAFSETDISKRELTGLYDFAIYDDDATGGRGLIYTARNPKLLTRTLQINTDPSNDRITSIYIETAKHDFFGSSKKKLLYVPMRIIQIQQSDHNLLGKAQDLRVEYRFMQEDPIEQI